MDCCPSIIALYFPKALSLLEFGTASAHSLSISLCSWEGLETPQLEACWGALLDKAIYPRRANAPVSAQLLMSLRSVLLCWSLASMGPGLTFYFKERKKKVNSGPFACISWAWAVVESEVRNSSSPPAVRMFSAVIKLDNSWNS